MRATLLNHLVRNIYLLSAFHLLLKTGHES